MEQQNETPRNDTEKKQWTTPKCEEMEDIEIAGGAGPSPENVGGAIS